jgi:hypothetical protein
MRSSHLQSKVFNYLDELNYKHVTEHECCIRPINPLTGHYLPYDNEVVDLKLIIEVMGVQHYKITYWAIMASQKLNITPEEYLQDIQWRDEYKKQEALKAGYHYLAIPYWTEKDESYKTLIDDKIAEIKALN